MPKKQTELKGIEAPSIEEIDIAAEGYVSVRDKRIDMLAKEVAHKTTLLGLMDKHKLTTYRFDDQIVEVQPSRKVKVKSIHDNGDDGE